VIGPWGLAPSHCEQLPRRETRPLGGSMTAGPLTRPNDPGQGWLRPGTDQVAAKPPDQLTPTIGSRSAPGAASGTAGFFGCTAASRR
jgi:hypothetical protein